jgi:hypothetical protein
MSVCVVSPYVRMVARRTKPYVSLMSCGAEMDTAPEETAAEYMASTLSTSKATSGKHDQLWTLYVRICDNIPLTASPWRSWCS